MSAQVCGCDGNYRCTAHKDYTGRPLDRAPVPHCEIISDAQKAAFENTTADKTSKAPIGVRTFTTGANRDTETGKFDYEGFLSPLVLERFAAYMHKNRLLKDGSLRDSDNWQKGIPKTVYMKSAWRHLMEWWKLHRQGPPSEALEEAICGVLFNAMGYLHETLVKRPNV